MSFLHNDESEYLAARITNKGRQRIAEGNFNISYFQIGDSEFDYNFSQLDGSGANTRPNQKVFTPLDKDSIVKYPYKLSQSTVTGTTYGNAIQDALTETIRNVIGPAGFVTKHVDFTNDSCDGGCDGSKIMCDWSEINIQNLNGTTSLHVPTGHTYSGCEYITIAFTRLIQNDIISGTSSSMLYKIMNVTTGVSYNTITLDRPTPNLTTLTGIATVICNNCNPFFPGPYNTDLTCLPNTQNPEDQQDPWRLNIAWADATADNTPSGMPAGMDVPTNIDEFLTGYTSNTFTSTKEFLGYNTSSGQTTNTGTTITNSFFENIIVTPEEQHSLAIIHYAQVGDDREPDKFFKYEDYISSDDSSDEVAFVLDADTCMLTGITDTNYFQIYIPFIHYERNTGSTIGAYFKMGGQDHYINSTAIDTKINKLKYRYLVDEQGYNVGKVFVNHKTIVFDDQEIVAALDYKTNRRYTLPIPRASQVAVDTHCNTNGTPLSPLMSGTTGQTIFISYLFQYTGDTYVNGMHLNHYIKVTGTSLNADVSIKFNDNDFKFMTDSFVNYPNGYVANSFKVLVQRVNTGDQPETNGWKFIDLTSQIPNHVVGHIIDPDNMKGSRFTITGDAYEIADDNGDKYDIENYLGNFPDFTGFTYNQTPEFGDEQPFPGSVRLVRATDLHVMRFMINLPDGEFTTSQNPSYYSARTHNQYLQNRVTEIGLLDENKDVLVIAKTPKPLVRTGTQVFAVKIDI